MFKHVDTEMIIPAAVRICMGIGLGWLFGTGRVHAREAIVAVAVLGVVWLIGSTLFILYIKKHYHAFFLGTHIVDTLLLMYLVWNTGDTSPLRYLLPVMVIPAGLFGSVPYASFVTVSMFMYSVAVLPDQVVDSTGTVQYWAVFYALAFSATLLLLAWRRIRKLHILFEQAEGNALAAERRYIALKHTHEALKTLDDVTGLMNLHHFRERVEEEIRRSHRYRYSFCVCVLSIDNLSRFELRFGAPETDRVLAQVARELSEQVRTTDHVAHHLRDQFMFLLPQTNARESLVPIVRIREQLRHLTFGDGQKKETLRFSIGVVCYPSDASEVRTLVRLADAALVQARRPNSNGVVLASSLYKKIP